MNIELKFDVSESLALEILTMCEDASSYWAQTEVLESRPAPNSDWRTLAARVHFVEYGDEENPVSEKTIGIPEVIDAIRRILTNEMTRHGKPIRASHALVGNHCRAELFRAVIDNDTDEIDNEIADIIAQVAVMGCIVYG